MKTIYKYPLPIHNRQHVMLPAGKPLTMQPQNNLPTLWFLQEPDAPKKPREVIMVGTGHEVPSDAGEFIGTAILFNDSLVMHVFMAKE